MKKKNLKEKNWLDIKFSVIAFFVLMILYWQLSIKLDEIRDSYGHITSGDNSSFIFVILSGIVLLLSLLGNILIQLFLNKVSEEDKKKSYLFFAALNIDMLFFGYVFFAEGIFSAIALGFIPILIKYLITRYYYKKLQKITLNEKINH